MTVADYIVDFFIRRGVRDAFGLPGGVILELLYAMARRKGEFSIHLNYHEQCSAFAACGFAQIGKTVGIAYATRGPGVTNLITGIADAYYDSIPVLFITAHMQNRPLEGMRIRVDQEMNPLNIVREITKYQTRVESVDCIRYELEKAFYLAATGRKGPVLLDVSTDLFSVMIEPTLLTSYSSICHKEKDMVAVTVDSIINALISAKRPVFLIGDGIHQAGVEKMMERVSKRFRIPVIASRSGQDIMPSSPEFFGYIGSHATRYGNFILSKADLIIALGNRMAFPEDSLSFRPIVEQTKMIRVDIDGGEFSRVFPHSKNFCIDLKELLPALLKQNMPLTTHDSWFSICRYLREQLWEYDVTPPVKMIAKILLSLDSNDIIISDVGNHEFWLSRAYAYAGVTNRLLISKSFGALGCSLARSIGAHYAARGKVVCFTGDQGFQLNLQELQMIADNQLPITIIVLNNHSSGMIRSREKLKFGQQFIHTTKNSGYGVPDIQNIAESYKIQYIHIYNTQDNSERFICRKNAPIIVEIIIDEEEELQPNLPSGNSCQNLVPKLSDGFYQFLDLL